MRPALARNAGGVDGVKAAGATQLACGPLSGRSTRSAPFSSSRAGRPLEGSGAAGGQRRGPERRFLRADQPGDRARLGAVVQQDGGYGACRQRGIDKDVGAAAGRQHHGAVAGRERLGGLPVERHDLDLVIFDFDRNNMALKAIYEPQPQPLMESG